MGVRSIRALACLFLLAAACATAEPESDAGGRRPAREQSPSREPVGAGAKAGEPQLVWVAVEDAHEVALVNVTRRRVVRRFPVSGPPHNITVQRRTVATAMQETGRIALIHRNEVREVDLGGSPHDIKGVGKVVIVANEGAARLDIVSLRGRLLRSIRLQADPHDIAIAPGAPVIWASLDDTDEMARVDLRRGVTYVPTGKRPHDLLFAPDGRLWVTDWGGALHVLERGRIKKSIPLGIEAHHLAFTPDGKEAWITDHGAHKVFVLDVESVEVLAELPIHGAPHHVAITPDGRWAVVADHDNGTLVVFSVSDRKQVGEIEVGPGPHGVWAQP